MSNEEIKCPKCGNKDLRIVDRIGYFKIQDINGKELECRIYRNLNYFTEKFKSIGNLDDLEVQGILKLDGNKPYVDVIDIKKKRN